ncbi:MAG: hypothetical protein ACHQNA_07265 [Acidimicrobiales bacterium]
MSEVRPEELGETPTIEVRVYRRGELIRRELCESEEEAALVVEGWAEVEDVECEVDDLSVRHRPGDVLEPELAEDRTDDYRSEVEIDRGGAG